MYFVIFPDLDECREDKGVCSGGKCSNTPGGYTCICGTGLRPSEDLRDCIGVFSLLFIFVFKREVRLLFMKLANFLQILDMRFTCHHFS